MFPTFWNQLSNWMETGLYYVSNTFGLNDTMADFTGTLNAVRHAVDVIVDFVLSVVPVLSNTFFF